jgi:hypothetical protein
MLAALRGRPFVFEVRDLWPASIVAVGAMKDSPVVRWLEKLELFLYRRAAAVVTVTDAFKRDLTRRGVVEDKIAVVMNGIECSRYEPNVRDELLALQHDVKDKFVVGYIGTHGMAHALHRILDAAELLREQEDIVFLFVGGGAAREALVREAETRGLKNVRLVSRQPKEAMLKFLGLCDVALIHLKDDPLFESVIPSKIFEAMGMGLPILLALPEGEAAALVRNTGAGVVIPPERPERLAGAVLELHNQPALRERLSRAGQSVAPRYSRKRQAAKMVAVFEAVMEGSGSVGELLPELATIGPNVEEHVASVGGTESSAAGRRYERQDYLTRLLVSATYGAFESPNRALPRPLIPSVQELIGGSIDPDRHSKINSECRLLSQETIFAGDRELWQAAWRRKAAPHCLSVALLQLLLVLGKTESRHRFFESVNSVVENRIAGLDADDMFDKVFQRWFQPVKENLSDSEFCRQLDHELGYPVADRAKSALEGFASA